LFSLSEVDWNQDEYNMEIFYYALSGAMIGTILFIFIPVAIWYNRVKKEISEATTSYPSAEYNTLAGDTMLPGRFLSNEETGERVQLTWPDDQGEVDAASNRRGSASDNDSQ
jgi:hypothetical protein